MIKKQRNNKPLLNKNKKKLVWAICLVDYNISLDKQLKYLSLQKLLYLLSQIKNVLGLSVYIISYYIIILLLFFKGI